MYDALPFAQNNYYGTARSVALGNAVTALGGDLGMVGINPAGSAVNDFWQFSITPALLFQSTDTRWSADGSESFGSPYRTSHTKFNVPNCGLNIVFYSDDDQSVLKYVTTGFVVNTVNTYLDYSYAHGSNNRTSYLGNLAGGVLGSSPDVWNDRLYTAYLGGQISEFGPDGSCRYSGANQMVAPSEAYAYVPGELSQASELVRYGSMSDVILNIGFNMSDKFYFGFNLGLPVSTFNRVDSFSETAGSPVAFPVNLLDKDGKHIGREGEPTTYYKSSFSEFRLVSQVSGIYGKFGFIWLPVAGLRVGAAIQSPSFLTVDESYKYTATTTYEDKKYNGNDEYRDGDIYNLRTPYKVNAGIAYALGVNGLLSVDYEMADYSVMKFSDPEVNFINSGGSDWMSWENRKMKQFLGVSHSLRAGLEIKPTPELAVRAGYGFITSQERYATDARTGYMVYAESWAGPDQELKDFRYFNDVTHSFSLGLGYYSHGSFFADAAVRLTKYPASPVAPYYFADYDVFDKDGKLLDVGMPYYTRDRRIVDLLLTIGWRF